MKTVVVGVFDQLPAAEHVIAQLAASPLDMDSIQVVHADTTVQSGLIQGAGLPARRAALSSLFLGAALGAAAGFWLTGGLGGKAWIEVGALLGAAAGLVLGSLAGLAAGLLGERTEIPEADRHALLRALADGATVVTVRTENLPTARAIGDLFRAGGSLTMTESAGGAVPTPPAPRPIRRARPEPSAALLEPEATPPSPGLPEEHQPFAPPWRRGEAEAAAIEAPAPPAAPDGAGDAAFQLFPEAAPAARRREIRHGDVLTGPDTSSRAVQFPEVQPMAAWAQAPAPTALVADSDESLLSMDLPARVIRALRDYGIADRPALERFLDHDPTALDRVPGIGPASQMQIRRALAPGATDPGAARS